jgi:RNA polymerase sigma-70 factor (ECF subfamily)
MSILEFNEALARYQNPLHFFALKLTSDEEAAKDLLQETYLRALNYRDKLITKASIKGWLYTIMRNTFINQYRRESKYADIMNQMEHQSYISTRASERSITPDKELNIKDMENAIDQLEDGFKTPFRMKLEGYKYKEISDHMGIPIGTVKSRIFLARKQLFQILPEHAPAYV